MRFKIILSPACKDKCRCGIKRSSWITISSRVGSISTASIDDSRRRANSGTSSRMGAPARPDQPRQYQAIAGDIDARQHNLIMPARHQIAALGHHFAIGTERIAAPNGMMQKVQRWSHRFNLHAGARATVAALCAGVARVRAMSLTAGYLQHKPRVDFLHCPARGQLPAWRRNSARPSAARRLR